MIKQISYLFILGAWFLTFAISAQPLQWQTLAPGLEYASLKLSNGVAFGQMHAFRMDLHHYQLELMTPLKEMSPDSSISNLLAQHHSIIATNGGFFTPENEPLGLRIQNGKKTNSIKTISWWHIFYIENNKAYITPYKSFQLNPNINFAIQSGPRLVMNGKIPQLKPGVANRTALGITKSGKVILLATENLPLTTTQLAEIMRRPTQQGGLGCINAVNLDGGRSTQLVTNISALMINTENNTQVADWVTIKEKK